MVLKNGFGEQLTAHRLGRALSTLLPEIDLISTIYMVTLVVVVRKE